MRWLRLTVRKWLIWQKMEQGFSNLTNCPINQPKRGLCNPLVLLGCGAGIRTPINGSRFRCPTIRRLRNGMRIIPNTALKLLTKSDEILDTGLWFKGVMKMARKSASSKMKMSSLQMLSWVLVTVGALNWGLVGLLDINLVDMLLGTWSGLVKVVYILVGLAGVYSVWGMFTMDK